MTGWCPQGRGGGLVARGGVVVLAAIVMVAAGVLAARWCMRLLRRRLQRRDWDDLIARHRDLDRELTRIWRQR